VYFHDRKHDGIPGCIRNLSALCRQITDLEGHQAIVIIASSRLPTVYQKPPSHPSGWRGQGWIYTRRCSSGGLSKRSMPPPVLLNRSWPRLKRPAHAFAVEDTDIVLSIQNCLIALDLGENNEIDALIDPDYRRCVIAQYFSGRALSMPWMMSVNIREYSRRLCATTLNQRPGSAELRIIPSSSGSTRV